MDTQTNHTSEKQKTSTVIPQDILALEMSPIDKSTADYEIGQCNTHLFINGAPINHLIAPIPIPMNAITTLIAAAMGLKTVELNYVIGLKMHFIVENNLVNLLYQPVYMSRPPSVIGEPMYNVAEGGYYRFDIPSKTFQPVTITRFIETMKASYRNNIRIKHRLDTTPTTYIPNEDTDAVIFPFQTIEELVKDNDGNGFFIHNAVRKEPVGGAYSIKHCLLLSSSLLTGNIFKGKYANRSHLCPPSCNSIQYALASI